VIETLLFVANLRIESFQNRLQKPLFLTKPLKPLDAGFMAKPCQLTLCVVPNIELGLFNSTRQVALSEQVFNYTAVPVSA
jgi:hypothetical protein